jgi:tetratricopeptide (TPR) repeat protein
MWQARLRRIAARFAIVAMLALTGGISVLAAEDLDALNRQVVKLYGKGKYKQATVIAEKALALAQRTLGPEHPWTLSSVRDVGVLYDKLGRYAEAEPLYKGALAGREKALGPEHPDTLTSVNNLGISLSGAGPL